MISRSAVSKSFGNSCLKKPVILSDLLPACLQQGEDGRSGGQGGGHGSFTGSHGGSHGLGFGGGPAGGRGGGVCLLGSCTLFLQ